MLNSITALKNDTQDNMTHQRVVNPSKKMSVTTLIALSMLALTACQNAPSNIHTAPAKPIVIAKSATQTQIPDPNTSSNAAAPRQVIYIDVPPATVPKSQSTNLPSNLPPKSSPIRSSPIIDNSSTITTSQDDVDILTSPSETQASKTQTSKAQDGGRTRPTSIINPSATPNNNTAPGSTTSVSTVPSSKGNSTNSVPSHTTQQPTYTPANPVPEPDRRTPQEILLERARSNSQTTPTTGAPVLENGDTVPAFRRLMQTGIGQLQSGNYAAADSTFTRAQRLAPQSSTVYFYLGQVALKRNQPYRAEAMARRGLVVAQTDSRRQNLWQIILLAGEQQQNTRVINEAKAALASLSR